MRQKKIMESAKVCPVEGEEGGNGNDFKKDGEYGSE